MEIFGIGLDELIVWPVILSVGAVLSLVLIFGSGKVRMNVYTNDLISLGGAMLYIITIMGAVVLQVIWLALLMLALVLLLVAGLSYPVLQDWIELRRRLHSFEDERKAPQ